ncbi:MAG: hypothetical protein ACI9D4_002002 [Polaribacter sp.]|jgi:hypothetical protein
MKLKSIYLVVCISITALIIKSYYIGKDSAAREKRYYQTTIKN